MTRCISGALIVGVVPWLILSEAARLGRNRIHGNDTVDKRFSSIILCVGYSTREMLKEIAGGWGFKNKTVPGSKYELQAPMRNRNGICDLA